MCREHDLFVMPMDVKVLDAKWNNTHIKTLSVVERKIRRSKNAYLSHEIAFLVSNKVLKTNTEHSIRYFDTGNIVIKAALTNYFKHYFQ